MKKFLKKLVEKFAPKAKEEIKEFAQEAIEELKIKFENYDYEVKINALVEFVMSKIKIPMWLKPFKWVIKTVIRETAEELIEQIEKALKK